MPVIDVKGLPGLKGWGQLSSEEKQQWLNQHPSAKGATLRQIQNAYENSQFINEFGENAFKANSKSVRQQMMRDKVIGDKFSEVYGDEEDFDELNMMTTEGKASLLSKGMRTTKENEEVLAGFKESQKITQHAPGGSPAAQMYFANTQEREKDFVNHLMSDRNNLKSEVLAEDNARKQKSVESLSKRYLAASQNAYNRGELSEAQINDTFNQIVNGSEETGLPGSRYYQTFKDTKYFKDFSLDDKMNIIAQFSAMRDAYGAYDAVDSLDRNMQSKVSKEQGWARQLGNTVLNIGSGSVAYLMQSLMAFDTLSKLGDRESYANFMEGKDKDGNPLPNIWNL